MNSELYDAIVEFGNKKKSELVALNFDDSGEGYTKIELRRMDRGTLLAMLLDGLFNQDEDVGQE